MAEVDSQHFDRVVESIRANTKHMELQSSFKDKQKSKGERMMANLRKDRSSTKSNEHQTSIASLLYKQSTLEVIRRNMVNSVLELDSESRNDLQKENIEINEHKPTSANELKKQQTQSIGGSIGFDKRLSNKRLNDEKCNSENVESALDRDRDRYNLWRSQIGKMKRTKTS